jgi:cytochrome P450
MMEATLLLATIAQSFRLRTLPGHPVATSPSFTLRPKYGLRMKLAVRQAVAADPQPRLDIAHSARN